MSTASAIPQLSVAEEIFVLSEPFTLPSGIVVPNRIWKAACVRINSTLTRRSRLV